MSFETTFARLFDQFAGRADVSLLEVGCGSGEDLTAAVARGWRCFGVEPSEALRAEAKQRLGDGAHVVAGIDDLFAHRFDVVAIAAGFGPLTETLYQLFSAGTIAPNTIVVAEKGAAEDVPGVLRRLRFTEISGDDPVTAKGSDFQSFMQERYVPGTWSKIAAYEHVPRYSLAKPLAAGLSALDFGCGTGYGAAMLAEVAREVTGLDIDESALVWAREAHVENGGRSNLNFICRDDLGASLPEASFDLITCFEMIEHVDLATQQKVIASLARLLKPDGLFLISTPNPDVTKLYGVNPYHVREMTEAELRDLVSPHFAHVSVLGQHVRAGITFSQSGQSGILRPASMMPGERAEHPMAFIAICSRQPLREIADTVFFDDGSNYIGDFMGHEKKLQEARGEAYSQRAHATSAEAQYRIMSAQRNDAVAQLNQATQAKLDLEHAKKAVEQARDAAEQARDATEAARVALQREYDLKIGQINDLVRMREEELRSPRFLARGLWQAVKTRLRTKLSSR